MGIVLKSSKATNTTLAMSDTFSKIRELERLSSRMPVIKADSAEAKSFLQRAGVIIAELVAPQSLDAGETEASVEVNFPVVKFKY